MATEKIYFKNNISLYANITSVIIVFSILGYAAISPLPLFFDIDSRDITIPFRILILVLSLILIGYRILSKEILAFNFFWSMWWVFWVSYVSRLFFDYIYNPQALRLTLLEYLGYILGTCFFPAISVSIFSRKICLLKLKKYFFIVGLIAIFLNCWLLYFMQKDALLIDFFEIRQGTATLNPISLAHVGVTLALLSLNSLFQLSARSAGRQVFIFGVLFLGLLTVFLGASRGPMLSLFILAPAIIFFNGAVKRLRHVNLLVWFFLFLFAAIIICSIALGIDIVPSNMALTRMKTLFEDSERKELYSQGISVFLEHPFIGAGIEPIGYYPHNTILESFMLNGVVSGFIYLSLIAQTTFYAFRSFRIEPNASWLPILFFQYLMADMVSGSLYGSCSTWVLMSFIVARYQYLK